MNSSKTKNNFIWSSLILSFLLIGFLFFFNEVNAQVRTSFPGGTFPGGSEMSGGGTFSGGGVSAPMDTIKTPGGTFKNLIKRFTIWLGYGVYLTVFIAFLLFLMGMLKYVTGGADEEKRQEAKNLIIYGIAGLFIMVSVWALVYWLGSAIGIRPGGIIDLPGMPGNTEGQNLILGGEDSDLVKLIKNLGGLMGDIILLIMALAMFLFLWGITRYITSGADEEKRTEARRLVTYGIVGLFVMASVWSLVYFIGASVGINVGNGIIISQITGSDVGTIGVDGEALTTCEAWSTVKNPSTGEMPGVSFKNFVCLILKVLNPIPPILMALAMMYFFWGIAKYMNSAGDAEEMKSGKNTIIYGILGLFIMAALWSLVYLVRQEFGLFLFASKIFIIFFSRAP
jgi:hypothetical protein